MCWNCDWMGPKHHDLSMALCPYSHTSSVCESLTVSWLKTVTSAIILVSSSFGMTIVLQSQLDRKATTKKTSMFRKRIVEAWQLPSALNKIHHCAVTNSRMDLNLQGCSRKCKNVDQSSSSTWSKKKRREFHGTKQRTTSAKKNPRCGRRSLWAGTKDYNQRRKLLPSNACKQEEWFNRPFFLFLCQVQTCWVASCPECWQHELHPPRPPSRPSWPQGRNQPWRIWRISGLA